MSLLWRAVGVWLVAVGGAGLVNPRWIIRYQMGRQIGVDVDDVDPSDRRVLLTRATGGVVAAAGLALAVTGALPT